jgi:hypothetical protein
LIIGIQKSAAWALTAMLIVVVVLSTGDLGVLLTFN